MPGETRVAIPAETAPGERRVAMAPDLVGRLTAGGLQIIVQAGAGGHARHDDEAYAAAGAAVVPGDPVPGADIV
ncbi:MAG: NAD(P)(+) transhydrogenase (Re/Si-specific) subunit alpha, partial [Actinomycetota bacterium]|nr:NAD(P)(+) transhydrogenase (Re/Si-specific) subunit alpha [Actinomycetota bacterium]